MRSGLLLGLVFALAAPLSTAQQPNPIPTEFKTVYPAPEQAQQDLQKAIQAATQEHKRIIVNFGTNDAADCQVLAEFFEFYINAKQIEEHFLVVPVNVGKDLDQNRDLAQRFGVSVADGLPVLIVLDSAGNVLARENEFRSARYMSPNDLTVLLNKWRGEARDAETGGSPDGSAVPK